MSSPVGRPQGEGMTTSGQPATLTFLGAAGTVTGSKLLVESSSGQLLVDCGLFQGGGELRRKNWEPLPLSAASVAEVALTHAHLDHCGFLPRLVADGFAGPVYATEATVALAGIVLRDSAHLQEEDAAAAAAHGGSKHAVPLPLYTVRDVERMLHQFVPVDFHTVVDGTAARLTFVPAGHILGAASVVVETAGGGSLLVSGDLGRGTHPLLRAPVPAPGARAIVVESTYGNRTHPEPDDWALADVIRRTAARGGSVIIPAFAVDRTEVILMALHRLTQAGDIPSLPVYVDSPMALAALEVYRKAIASGDETLRVLSPGDPFDPGQLHEVSDADESRRLNQPREPSILISASGMATGGRVVHHLAQLLPDRRNAVALVGYQALGTRGRDLAEGARALKMLGHYVPVHAEVVSLPQYSIHADADEILRWLASAPYPPEVVYVAHGEPAAAAALAERISADLGWLAVVPRQGERVVLG